jgi:uncharacterized protein (DUF1684 family)
MATRHLKTLALFVILDFNEAYNPPCAFNEFTTCPPPLPENRLAIRIPAGELTYLK